MRRGLVKSRSYTFVEFLPSRIIACLSGVVEALVQVLLEGLLEHASPASQAGGTAAAGRPQCSSAAHGAWPDTRAPKHARAFPGAVEAICLKVRQLVGCIPRPEDLYLLHAPGIRKAEVKSKIILE